MSADLFSQMSKSHKIQIGRERLLNCLIKRGAQHQPIQHSDMQKAYFAEHSVQLDKSELQRIFGIGKLQQVLQLYMENELEISTDPAQNGMLFLKIKKPLNETNSSELNVQELPNNDGQLTNKALPLNNNNDESGPSSSIGLFPGLIGQNGNAQESNKNGKMKTKKKLPKWQKALNKANKKKDELMKAMFAPIWDIALFERAANCKECGQQILLTEGQNQNQNSEAKLVQHMMDAHPQYAAKLVEKQFQMAGQQQQKQNDINNKFGALPTRRTPPNNRFQSATATGANTIPLGQKTKRQSFSIDGFDGFISAAATGANTIPLGQKTWGAVDGGGECSSSNLPQFVGAFNTRDSVGIGAPLLKNHRNADAFLSSSAPGDENTDSEEEEKHSRAILVHTHTERSEEELLCCWLFYNEHEKCLENPCHSMKSKIPFDFDPVPGQAFNIVYKKMVNSRSIGIVSIQQNSTGGNVVEHLSLSQKESLQSLEMLWRELDQKQILRDTAEEGKCLEESSTDDNDEEAEDEQNENKSAIGSTFSANDETEDADAFANGNEDEERDSVRNAEDGDADFCRSDSDDEKFDDREEDDCESEGNSGGDKGSTDDINNEGNHSDDESGNDGDNDDFCENDSSHNDNNKYSENNDANGVIKHVNGEDNEEESNNGEDVFDCNNDQIDDGEPSDGSNDDICNEDGNYDYDDDKGESENNYYIDENDDGENFGGEYE